MPFNPYGSFMDFSSQNWSAAADDILSSHNSETKKDDSDQQKKPSEVPPRAPSPDFPLSLEDSAGEKVEPKNLSSNTSDLRTSVSVQSTATAMQDSFSFEINLPPEADVSPLSCKESVVGGMMSHKIGTALEGPPIKEIRRPTAEKRRNSRARSKSRSRGTSKARGSSKISGSMPRSRSVDRASESDGIGKKKERRGRKPRSRSTARHSTKTKEVGAGKSRVRASMLTEIKEGIELKERRSKRRSPSRNRGKSKAPEQRRRHVQNDDELQVRRSDMNRTSPLILSKKEPIKEAVPKNIPEASNGRRSSRRDRGKSRDPSRPRQSREGHKTTWGDINKLREIKKPKEKKSNSGLISVEPQLQTVMIRRPDMPSVNKEKASVALQSPVSNSTSRMNPSASPLLSPSTKDSLKSNRRSETLCPSPSHQDFFPMDQQSPFSPENAKVVIMDIKERTRQSRIRQGSLKNDDRSVGDASTIFSRESRTSFDPFAKVVPLRNTHLPPKTRPALVSSTSSTSQSNFSSGSPSVRSEPVNNGSPDLLRTASDLMKNQRLKMNASRARQKKLSDLGIGKDSAEAFESGDIVSMSESIDSTPSQNRWKLMSNLKKSTSHRRSREDVGADSTKETSLKSSWGTLKSPGQLSKRVLGLGRSMEEGVPGQVQENTLTSPIPEDASIEESFHSHDISASSPEKKWSPSKLSKWASRKGHEIMATAGRKSEHRRFLLDDDDDKYA